MELNRRVFLKSAAAVAAVGPAIGIPEAGWARGTPAPSRPNSKLDQLVSAINPELRLWNANTGERMSTRFFGPDGYDEGEIRRINWFMRDWRENAIKPFDVRVLWALAAVRQAGMQDGHDGEIRFLSGFRTRKTNDMLRRKNGGAAKNSFHIDARANDFSLPGMPVKTVYDYCMWLEVGGVGHYPGSFVHMDSGRVRTWQG